MGILSKMGRHEFYKKLLKYVCNDPEVGYGLCLACKKASDYDVELYQLPELIAKMPKREDPYWFPCTYAGWEKRIALIERCIEETKPKKK